MGSSTIQGSFPRLGMFFGVKSMKLPLEEQVKWLKERHKVVANYFGYLMNEEGYMKNAAGWVHAFPGQWPQDWGLIHMYARQFSDNWAYDDFAEAKLTQDQKKKLVATLDGYCVQEDFDSIVSSLNFVQQQEPAKTLAGTFIIKTVVDKFFEHPFWYVEAIPAGAQEQCEETP
ncbi:hypothetical protein BDV06DRAFT_220090 [Aspergillus oleicola]